MQTRVDLKKRTALYAFVSINEFGDWIKNTAPNWRFHESTDYPPSTSWDLRSGYDNAVHMARYGWNEGAEKVQEALKAFIPQTAAVDTKVDFYGFRPHVPRFCAGMPDNMIRHAPIADMGCGRVLTLAVGLDANASTDAAHMANFGVAVAQYINQLETQGTRVEVIGVLVETYRDTGWREAHAVTIKMADQPLDLAVLAFAIGHPAMLRRLGFAAQERSAAPACPTYGQAVDAKVSDIINAPVGTVILNGMKDANKHAQTPEAALEYITAQIEKAMEAQYDER